MQTFSQYLANSGITKEVDIWPCVFCKDGGIPASDNTLIERLNAARTRIEAELSISTPYAVSTSHEVRGFLIDTLSMEEWQIERFVQHVENHLVIMETERTASGGSGKVETCSALFRCSNISAMLGQTQASLKYLNLLQPAFKTLEPLQQELLTRRAFQDVSCAELHPRQIEANLACCSAFASFVIDIQAERLLVSLIKHLLSLLRYILKRGEPYSEQVLLSLAHDWNERLVLPYRDFAASYISRFAEHVASRGRQDLLEQLKTLFPKLQFDEPASLPPSEEIQHAQIATSQSSKLEEKMIDEVVFSRMRGQFRRSALSIVPNEWNQSEIHLKGLLTPQRVYLKELSSPAKIVEFTADSKKLEICMSIERQWNEILLGSDRIFTNWRENEAQSFEQQFEIVLRPDRYD